MGSTAADRTTDTSVHQRGGATSAGPDPTDTEAAGPTSDRRTVTERPHPAENRDDEDASDPIGDGRACPSVGPGRRSRTPMARPSRVRGSPADAPDSDEPGTDDGPGTDDEPGTDDADEPRTDDGVEPGDDGTAAVTASSPGSRCARPRASR
ncbi:hypothetical protein ASF78_13125 [Cellulomonas sp. Leaf334]|nr:hypothetical protein ASF78_13125 [Cellulomonas sp. Leaf334]